jgi:hypothetical protein
LVFFFQFLQQRASSTPLPPRHRWPPRFAGSPHTTRATTSGDGGFFCDRLHLDDTAQILARYTPPRMYFTCALQPPRRPTTSLLLPPRRRTPHPLPAPPPQATMVFLAANVSSATPPYRSMCTANHDEHHHPHAVRWR